MPVLAAATCARSSARSLIPVRPGSRPASPRRPVAPGEVRDRLHLQVGRRRGRRHHADDAGAEVGPRDRSNLGGRPDGDVLERRCRAEGRPSRSHRRAARAPARCSRGSRRRAGAGARAGHPTAASRRQPVAGPPRRRSEVVRPLQGRGGPVRPVGASPVRPARDAQGERPGSDGCLRTVTSTRPSHG